MMVMRHDVKFEQKVLLDFTFYDFGIDINIFRVCTFEL